MKIIQNWKFMGSFFIGISVVETMILLLYVFYPTSILLYYIASILLFSVFVLFAGYRYSFSIIKISSESIEIKIPGKSTTVIHWKEINNIHKKSMYLSPSLVFTDCNSNMILYFNFSRKQIHKLIELCPVIKLRLILEKMVNRQ